MPDTQNYLIIGYIFAFAILGLTVGSLWWRYRNLMADEATLEALATEIKEETTQPTAASEAVRA